MISHTDVIRRPDEAARAAAGKDIPPAEAPPAADYRLSASPAHLLRRAQQYASDIFAQAGLADGVTLRQTVVLAAVAEEEGRSQSELVRATGVDRSTLADMIARMEKRDLVSRNTALEDGRAKSVFLTAAGRARLEAALPAMQAADAALIATLPRNKQRAFRETLTWLADAADRMDVDDVDTAKRAKKAAKAEEKARKKKKKKKKKKDKEK